MGLLVHRLLLLIASQRPQSRLSLPIPPNHRRIQSLPRRPPQQALLRIPNVIQFFLFESPKSSIPKTWSSLDLTKEEALVFVAPELALILICQLMFSLEAQVQENWSNIKNLESGLRSRRQSWTGEKKRERDGKNKERKK